VKRLAHIHIKTIILTEGLASGPKDFSTHTHKNNHFNGCVSQWSTDSVQGNLRRLLDQYFLLAGCSFWHRSKSIKALEAQWYKSLQYASKLLTYLCIPYTILQRNC